MSEKGGGHAGNLDQDTRNRIKVQIHEAKLSERRITEPYYMSNGASQYIARLYGLENFFNYIPQERPILDVGVGKGYAIQEFRELPIGEKRQFLGTALRFAPILKDTIGEGNFRITYGEALDRIKDDSIGGILGLYSAAAYSEYPALVARSYDRVLVHGGGIKVTVKDEAEKLNQSEFIEELIGLGYDVVKFQGKQSILKKNINEFTDPVIFQIPPIVVLALKPGGQTGISAQELFENDRKSAKKQYRQAQLNLLMHHPTRTILRSVRRAYR